MTTNKNYLTATANAAIRHKDSLTALNEKKKAILDGAYLPKDDVLAVLVKLAAHFRCGVLDLAPQIARELDEVVHFDRSQYGAIIQAIENATFAMLQRFSETTVEEFDAINPDESFVRISHGRVYATESGTRHKSKHVTQPPMGHP